MTRITNPYRPDPLTGYKVDSQEFTLKDTSRNKELMIKVSFPQKPKAGFITKDFPIVIISPLALGGKDCYEWITNELVKCSCVVITVSHKDNIKVQRATKGFGFLLKEGPKQAILNVMEDPSFWLDRICDIIFLIKQIPKIEQAITMIRGLVKKSSVGIFGHSLGALTAMLAAGVRIQIPERNLSHITNPAYQPTPETVDGKVLYSWKIPEIGAAVIVSPIGPDAHFGLTEHSYTYNVPCFFITANRDHSFGKENLNNAWKRQAFDLAQANEIKKYMLLFFETDHGFGDIAGCKVVSTFAGWSASVPIRAVVFMCSLAFFEFSLKSSPNAAKWLDTSMNSAFDQLAFVEVKYEDPNAPKAAPAAAPGQALPPTPQPGYPSVSGYPTGAPGGYPHGYSSQPGAGYPGQPQPGFPPGAAPPGQPNYQSGIPGYPPAQAGYPGQVHPAQASLYQSGGPGQLGYPAAQPGYPSHPQPGQASAGYAQYPQGYVYYSSAAPGQPGSPVLAQNPPGYPPASAYSQAVSYSAQQPAAGYPAYSSSHNYPPASDPSAYPGYPPQQAYQPPPQGLERQGSFNQPFQQAPPAGYPPGSYPPQSQPAAQPTTGQPAVPQQAQTGQSQPDIPGQPGYLSGVPGQAGIPSGPPAPPTAPPAVSQENQQVINNAGGTPGVSQSQSEQTATQSQPGAPVFDLLYPAREEKKRYKLDASITLAPPPTIEQTEENKS